MVIKRTRPSGENAAASRVSTRCVQHPDVEAGAKIVVGRGDTLGSLAKQHGVSLKALKAANPLLTSDKRRGGNLLLPGDEVVLPAVAKPEALAHKTSHAEKRVMAPPSLPVEKAQMAVQPAAHEGPEAPGSIGHAFRHTRAKSPYKVVTAEFNGHDFIVFGDGKEVMRAEAQSGRGFVVSAEDAQKYGGSEGDSYLNNARYAAVRENGPLPEGSYEFRAEGMVLFTQRESIDLFFESQKLPSGQPIHDGDWAPAG